jgi:hypothetical protein
MHIKACVGLFVVLASICPVLADDAEDKFALDVLCTTDPSWVVPRVEVVKDLKLTDEQKAAVTRILLVESPEENNKFFLEAKKKYQGPAFQKYLQGQFEHDKNEIQWKKLKPVLTAEQWKRVQELIVQHQGAKAVGQASIAAGKLMLTGPQYQQIQAIIKKPPLKATKRADAISEEDRLKEALTVLTPEQLKEFDTLRGQLVSFNIMNASDLEMSPRPKRQQ